MEQVDGYDGRVFVSNDLHVSELVAEMRHSSLQRDSDRFKANARDVGAFLAYEVNKNEQFQYRTVGIETGLGIAEHRLREEDPVFLNILRAGNPMVEGFLRVFRQSPVSFQGAVRVEGSYDEGSGEMEVQAAYDRTPVDSLEGKTLIAPDIMLATGSSLVKSCKGLFGRLGKPGRVIVSSVISAPQGVERVLGEIENSKVYTASIDSGLNDQAYIVPGLGDAGDLSYNGGTRLLDQLEK